MVVTGLSRPAEQIVQRLTASWRAAPPVRVVQQTADLPMPVPEDVRGVYRARGGDVWIIEATQLRSEIPGTVAHEVLGHHAPRKALGANWSTFMGALHSGIRAGDARLLHVRNRVRSAYVDDSGAFNLSRIQEADEITAHCAELAFDGQRGRLHVGAPLRRRFEAAKGQFLRDALYADVPATFDQLVGVLLAAEHRLRHGGPLWGLGTRIRDWYAPAMPKFDPLARPMSLDESQTLLAAEAYRRKSAGEWKAMAMFAGAVLSGLVFVCSVIYMAFLLFGGLGSLFR